MADDHAKTIEDAIDHANILFAKVRNLALAAVATVAAIGAVAIAAIDQWNTARAHLLERKTVELEQKADEIDLHLEATDKAVVQNERRLDATPDAPPATIAVVP